MTDFFQVGIDYALSVLRGEILACKWVKLACQRQIDDLQRDDFPYVFDVKKAERPCLVIGKLKHIKGKWAGKNIELSPWQIFRITTVFGWVDQHGNRRFKTAYNEVTRKCGKSTEASGIGLYLAFCDDEQGAEVYSAATTRDQAKIVWNDARRMANKCPGFLRKFGVAAAAGSIYSEASSSIFKPLSKDHGGNLDGLNVHGAIIDELHAHKSRDVFDVIETAMGAREQALNWIITTAGSNRSGICFEQRTYATKVLEGLVVDDSYFAIIYTIDDDDDWFDEGCWIKAMPGLHVSVNIADVRRLALKASVMPSAQNNFKTKRLNQWVNADFSWMNMTSWYNCQDTDLRIDRFFGCQVYIAIDLSSRVDICSKAYVFAEGDQFTVFVKNYLPQDAIEENRNDQYAGWHKDGLISVNEGAMIDYQILENDLIEDSRIFNVAEVAFDPWQANYLMSNLLGAGVNAVEVRPTVKTMSFAMKELEGLVLDGRIKHSGCPVLNWMISNVIGHVDARDNIYPRKQFPNNKIDGAVALIMALGRAITNVGGDQLFDGD